MWAKDKSWVENFLSSWAVLLLGILAVTSLALRYVTDPVQCNIPPFSDAGPLKENCYQQKELLMVTDEIKEYMSQFGGSVEKLQELPKLRTYHQWVPFALGVAAILCLLPHVIGRMLSGLVWLDAHALLRTLWDNRSRKAEERRHALRESALLLQVGLRGSNWTLAAAALFRKVLTCAVCLILVVLIAVLFRPQLGAGQEQQLHKEQNFTSGVLPLPTQPFMCFMEVQQLRNVQFFVTQCSLPLNQVFLRGFAFLFYLFLLLLVVCVFDLLYWAGRLLLPSVRDSALIRTLSGISQSESREQVTDPAHFYRFLQTLGVDGRLLLAMTVDYCGPLVAVDLTNHLWLAFKGNPRPTSAPATRHSALQHVEAGGHLAVNGGLDQPSEAEKGYRNSDEIALSPRVQEAKL